MKSLLNRNVFIAAIIIATILLCGSVTYFLLARPAVPENGSENPASAALTVIPAPTGTPRTLPPTLTPIPPTATLPPTPAIGEFGIGAYVQVDTGGDALRIRPEPGLNLDPLFLAFDAEVFLITEGPRDADGYTWWFLTASYDNARAGWAAQDFLTVIPSP
jgi:hypothetical protein